MLRARSRMETMPTSVRPSMTGRCRNPPSSILSIASPTVASGPIVRGLRVVPFDTGDSRAGTELLDGREDISLGEDAHQRALLQHEDRTYPRRRHGGGGLGHRRRGLHRDQLGAHHIAHGRRHQPPSRVAFQNRTPLPVGYEKLDRVALMGAGAARDDTERCIDRGEDRAVTRRNWLRVPSLTPLGGPSDRPLSEPWGWLPRVERRVSQGSPARTTFGPR